MLLEACVTYVNAGKCHTFSALRENLDCVSHPGAALLHAGDVRPCDGFILFETWV